MENRVYGRLSSLYTFHSLIEHTPCSNWDHDINYVDSYLECPNYHDSLSPSLLVEHSTSFSSLISRVCSYHTECSAFWISPHLYSYSVFSHFKATYIANNNIILSNHYPLLFRKKIKECGLWGSNSRPRDYETRALPTEPNPPVFLL